MAKLNIDNKIYEVTEGKNLLEICLSLKKDLPYFCWHPAMGSVGACRQCAVKIFKEEKIWMYLALIIMCISAGQKMVCCKVLSAVTWLKFVLPGYLLIKH